MTSQGSDNKDNSVSKELKNKINTKTKLIPVHKTKAKKKPVTSLSSDINEPKVNEEVNPISIKMLFNRELCVNAEEPNKDIMNTMFKKI